MPSSSVPFSPIKTTISCSISGNTNSSKVISVIFDKWFAKNNLKSSAYATCKISAGITNAIFPLSERRFTQATINPTQVFTSLLDFIPCDTKISDISILWFSSRYWYLIYGGFPKIKSNFFSHVFS